MRETMASMASSWDDVVRAASETSGQPRGATLFLLGLALAPAIALGFPVLGVALDVALLGGDDRDAAVAEEPAAADGPVRVGDAAQHRSGILLTFHRLL